jgi:hypothetical protein
VAGAGKTRSENIADDQDDLARDLGQAKLDYAYGIADKQSQNRKNEAQDQDDLERERTELERDLKKRELGANIAYQKAEADAGWEFQKKSIDAWLDAAANTEDEDNSDYLGAIETASDEYAQALKAALDALRDERADVMRERRKFEEQFAQRHSLALANNESQLAADSRTA